MFAALNSVLQDFKLKPIRAGLSEREADKNQPCIVFFTVSEERISLLRSASRIAPRCVFLVSEPTWIQVIQENEKQCLYLLEGIEMDEFGQCFHTKFESPQKITFLGNFYTRSASIVYGETYQEKASKFEFYESLSDCPMSSGLELEEYTNDKLHTRLLASVSGVNVPLTMAFSFHPEKYHHYHPDTSDVKLFALLTGMSDRQIKDHLISFPTDKFVIKPSGKAWMGGRLCTIESKDNLDQAIEHFKHCSNLLNETDCLLIEEFVDSRITEDCQLGARLRVLVTRRPNNEVETSGIICNLGYIDQPINGDTSPAYSFDYLSNLLGLKTEQKQQILEKIYRVGETVLKTVIQYENQNLSYKPENKQTDFIGLDIILRSKTGELEPFLIEVNDHDCTSSLQHYESQHSSARLEILDKWIETILYRSYQYMLQGKNILVLGGGGYSKQNVYQIANRINAHIILVEGNINHYAADHSKIFINIDIDDHTKDIENAFSIVDAVGRQEIEVDGVITFWEDNVPLCALVANLLGKPGNNYQSASIAKSKLLTHRKILLDEKNKLFYEATGFSNGVEVFALKTKEDIDDIPKSCYPVVLKLDTGSCAFGVEIIQDREKLIARFEDYQQYIHTTVRPGAGLNFNYQIFATPYLKGAEHDVDLIMSNGELIGAYVTDNGATLPDSCKEMTAIMPSLLDIERQESLIHAAWKACRSVGLTNGVFNVEAIYTPLGVKIIEINARMGGFYISKWVFNIWDVDLILYSFLIACGIQPFINQISKSRAYHNGFLCYGSLHKTMINHAKLAALSSELDLFISVLDNKIPSEEIYEEPYASVAVVSKDIADGKLKMKTFLMQQGLELEEYKFISD